MHTRANQYIVVVDSGGTKIKTVLFDLKGEVLDTHIKHESGYVKLDARPVANSIAESINIVLQRNDVAPVKASIVAGISGVNSEPVSTQATRALAEQVSAAAVRIVNDADLIGMASAPQATIVVICGTGSSVIGYNLGQPVCKCSGVNEVLSDQGSAYWIGLNMLQATAKAIDGRATPFLLSDSVCAFFDIKSASELQLAVESGTETKRIVASVSSLLTPTLIAQDPSAKSIAEAAVQELYESVLAVRAQLPLKIAEKALVRFTGGVFSNNSYIFSGLVRKLKSHSGLSVDEAVTDAIVAGYSLAR